MMTLMANSKKVFISSNNPSVSYARSCGLLFVQEFSARRTFLLNKKRTDMITFISVLNDIFSYLNDIERLRGRGVEVSKTLFYLIGKFSLRRTLEQIKARRSGHTKQTDC